MTDERKPKAAALNTTGLVIRSKLPAVKPKRQYGDFDEFVALADRIVRTADTIEATCNRLSHEDELTIYAVKEAEGYLEQLPKLKAALAEFEEARKWHDRDELYEINKTTNARRLSLRKVSESVGLLLASISTCNPGDPEAFAAMMIEEVYAARPDACTLESACRHIRRKKKFCAIAEVLEAIDEQGTLWCRRWTAVRNSDISLDEHIAYWQDELATAIATGTALLEEAEQFRIELEAREKERKQQIEENNARYARERAEGIAKEAAEKAAASAKAKQERRERIARNLETIAARRAQLAEVEAFKVYFQLSMMSLGIFIGQHVRYAARPPTIAWYMKTRLAKGFYPEPSDAFVRILAEQVAAEQPPVTVDQLEAVCSFVLRWHDTLSVAAVLGVVREVQEQAGERPMSLPPPDDDDD